MSGMGDLYAFLGTERFQDMARKRGAGQRYGQAFMNALDTDRYHQLTGSPYDPFHSDDMADVWDAVTYLQGGRP